MTSWITQHPEWYIAERQLLAEHFSELIVDQSELRKGRLVSFGELVVRKPGGPLRQAIMVEYPAGTPFEQPRVYPLTQVPKLRADGSPETKPQVQMFDARHQMPLGQLCLFQHDSRGTPGGETIPITELLQRAGQWLLAQHTGNWPPDTADSELEAHFFPVADILVSAVFYGDRLKRRGRLNIMPDLRRFLTPGTTRGRAVVLLGATSTSEGNIEIPVGAEQELRTLYPWAGNPTWDNNQIVLDQATTPGLAPVSVGYWWDLPAEPVPFQDATKLQVCLREVGGAEALDAAIIQMFKEDTWTFGLRYPARRGGRKEWLFLCTTNPLSHVQRSAMPIMRDERLAMLNGVRVGVAKAHRLGADVLELRNSGVVKSSELQQKRVALVGLGALGSKVAEVLAQAGVGSFFLCDKDHLSTGNVARHVGGVDQFGELKTGVVRDRIRKISPFLGEVDTLNHSVLDDLGKLKNILNKADLAICTTADEGVESVVNDLAVSLARPVLYGRAMKNGAMGRVFLVRPHQDACKSCLARYLQLGRLGEETPDDWIDVPESDQTIVLHECGRPVIAASAVDLSFVASVIARRALDFLEGASTDENQWVWSREPQPEIDGRLDRALNCVGLQVPPHMACPTCATPAIAELVLSSNARALIEHEAGLAKDVETGGVLIGYVRDRRAIVVLATGPGPGATMTASVFRKDVLYTQKLIDQAASELADQGQYIGEWHTHVDQEPLPSARDQASLIGISESPDYLTRNPVMLIAKTSAESGAVKSMQAWLCRDGQRLVSISLSHASATPPSL